MTVTTKRPTTVRYYTGHGSVTESFTSAVQPAGEVIYHGGNAIETADAVLCAVTPNVHIVADRDSVEVTA